QEAGRVREAVRTSGLDAKTASLSEFIRIVGIERPAARRIISYRESVAANSLRPDWLLHVPVVEERALLNLGKRAYVRGPGAVFWQVGLWSLSLVAACVFVPVVVRKALPKGDPYLFPL